MKRALLSLLTASFILAPALGAQPELPEPDPRGFVLTEAEQARRNPFYHLLKTPKAAFDAAVGWRKMADSATTAEKKDDYRFKSRSAYELAGYLAGPDMDLRFSAALGFAEMSIESGRRGRYAPEGWQKIAMYGSLYAKQAGHPGWLDLWLRTAEYNEILLVEARKMQGDPEMKDREIMGSARSAADAYMRLLNHPAFEKAEFETELRGLAVYRQAVCECEGGPASLRSMLRRHKSNTKLGNTGVEQCLPLLEKVLESPHVPVLAKAHANALLAVHKSLKTDANGKITARFADSDFPYGLVPPGTCWTECVQAYVATAERLLNDKGAEQTWKLPWKSYLPESALPTKTIVREALDLVKKPR